MSSNLHAKLCRMERFVGEKEANRPCPACGGTGREGPAIITVVKEYTIAPDGNGWAGPPRIVDDRDVTKFDENGRCRRCRTPASVVTIDWIAAGPDGVYQSFSEFSARASSLNTQSEQFDG